MRLSSMLLLSSAKFQALLRSFVEISLTQALPQVDGCTCDEWSKTDEDSNSVSGFIIVAVGLNPCNVRAEKSLVPICCVIIHNHTKLRQFIIPFNLKRLNIVINPLESSLSRVSVRGTGARLSMYNCWRSFEEHWPGQVLTYRRLPARVSRLMT